MGHLPALRTNPVMAVPETEFWHWLIDTLSPEKTTLVSRRPGRPQTKDSRHPRGVLTSKKRKTDAVFGGTACMSSQHPFVLDSSYPRTLPAPVSGIGRNRVMAFWQQATSSMAPGHILSSSCVTSFPTSLDSQFDLFLHFAAPQPSPS